MPPLPEETKPKRDWDERHHLNGNENELKPKLMRDYFSAPQSLDELKADISQRKHMTKARKMLDEPEPPPPTLPTPISPDASPPVCPGRHTVGGEMPDPRDGQVRPWNDRWSNSVSMVNEGLHPAHRQYFAKKSLYEAAPSQRWRRFLDFESEKGVWRPIDAKPPRFGPMGV
jgi:hypothetical protein